MESLLETRFDERGGVISPDGRWLAFESNSSGRYEVYVRPFPHVNDGLWQISTAGGVQPLWGKAGSREIFYWDLKGTLKVVSLTLTPDLSVGGTRDVPLGDRYEPGVDGVGWRYQVSPLDGRLLLFRRPLGTENLAPIKVVVNWFEELRRLVPTR